MDKFMSKKPKKGIFRCIFNSKTSETQQQHHQNNKLVEIQVFFKAKLFFHSV